MESSSSTTEGPSLLETILYSTSTTSSPDIISETLEASTAVSLAAAATSSTSSEEISSSTTLSSLLEEDGESFLIANISSTISSLTSLEDDEDSNEMFADKIAGDYDVTSPLRVPKYFQAIITLFVCATLLICTIGIIKQVRLLCHKSSCAAAAAKIPLIRVSSAKDGSENDGLDSVLVENGKSKKDDQSPVQKKPGDRHFDYYSSSQQGKDASSVGNGNKSDGGDNNDDLLKLKKVRFVRRVSGPFSDEAMDFAGATYKTDPKDAPYLSKEKSKSSKKIEPQIKFSSMRKQSQPIIPSSSLPPSAAAAPPRPPPRSSSPPPPPPPRSSPPPL